MEQSYFNGILDIFRIIHAGNTGSDASFNIGGLVGQNDAKVLNNYAKGQLNSYVSNSHAYTIATLVGVVTYNASDNSQLKYNYSASEVNSYRNETLRIVKALGNSIPVVEKNYYLVDSESNPKINQNTSRTIDYSNGGAASTDHAGLIEINSTDLRNKRQFKTNSTWDFDNIWTYAKDINWNYPVLQAYYGKGARDMEVTIYNPHQYLDSTNQLGTVSIGDIDLLYKNADGKVVSDFGTIIEKDQNGNVVDSLGNSVNASEYEGITLYDNMSVIKFVYSIDSDEPANISIKNTSTGLVTSALFGSVIKAGSEVNGTVLAEDQTNYTERASTNNKDIKIDDVIEEDYYGLVITFNVRKFNVTVNATLTADEGTDGVEQKDFLTILLVHKNELGVVDHSYSVNLRNGQSYTFENIYNGNYDVEQVVDGNTIYLDNYGTYEIYIFYPIFYLNDIDSTTITMASNVSYNPTLIDAYKLSDYSQYTDIGTINNTNCASLSLGSFTLDTITRDIEFSVSINKSYEYWLHASSSNM